MKKEDSNHIKRVSKIDNLDKFMADAMKNEDERNKFQVYRENWAKTMTMDYVPKFPLHLEIDLFDTCNLKCEVCTRSYDRGTKDQMSFEDYKKIVDEGVENGLSSINHGVGSEPTLHKDICKMIEYAKSKGVLDLIVGTNGQILNPEQTIKLVKSGVTRIGFSIDAATSETYYKVRGADIKKVEDNVKAVAEYKKTNNLKLPILRTTFVNYSANTHEVQKFKDKWYDIVDYIDVQDYIPVPAPNMTIDTLNDFECKSFVCSMPFQRLTILVDGTIYPCCTFYSKLLPLGNIKNMSLKEAWNCEKMKELREQLKSGNYNKVCKNCYGSTQ